MKTLTAEQFKQKYGDTTSVPQPKIDSNKEAGGDLFTELGKLPQDLSQRINTLTAQTNELPQTNSPLEKLKGILATTVNIAGAGAGFAGDVLNRTVGTTLRSFSNTAATNPNSPFAGNNIVGQAVDDLSASLSKSLNFLQGIKQGAEANMPPELRSNLNSLINILALWAPEKVSPTLEGTIKTTSELPGAIASDVTSVAGKATELAGKVNQKINPLATKTGPLDEALVVERYNKSIRPTVAGKSSGTQIAQANKKALTGLKAISENRSTISLTTPEGEVVTGELPKTVAQLSEAIPQVKTQIFNKYNELAKQAGEKGITVNTSSIANELDPIINSKSLAVANPATIKYAKALKSRLLETGEIDAQTAQDIIQHYNESLKAFYRNPSYDTASRAGIDSLIANKFRSNLDAGISGATGEQYQALKNQYGALSSMEKDVAHRAVVLGRQNNVGFLSGLSNVASGAELVRGLVTLNPVDFATSVAIKGFQKYIQYLNNPDVGIEKIFSEINRVNPSATANIPAQTVLNTKEISSPISTTNSSLIQEAKKYATPEEFVKAQGEPIYRGVSKGVTEFKPSERGAYSDEGAFGVSPDKKVAARYRSGGGVLEGYLSSDAKIKIQPSRTGEKIGYALNESDFTAAKNEGYDGIKFLNKDDELEIKIFNPDVVKTKSQLTDIWKKANKK